MATDQQIGGTDTDRLFLDTDFTRDFHVLDLDTDASGATAKDIAGWAITLDARKTDASSTVLKSWTLSIIGSFNSVAATNTQRARWTAADTDLTIAAFGKSGGRYRYSLKRTDAGQELILQYGDIVIERATQAA